MSDDQEIVKRFCERCNCDVLVPGDAKKCPWCDYRWNAEQQMELDLLTLDASCPGNSLATCDTKPPLETAISKRSSTESLGASPSGTRAAVGSGLERSTPMDTDICVTEADDRAYTESLTKCSSGPSPKGYRSTTSAETERASTPRTLSPSHSERTYLGAKDGQPKTHERRTAQRATSTAPKTRESTLSMEADGVDGAPPRECDEYGHEPVPVASRTGRSTA